MLPLNRVRRLLAVPLLGAVATVVVPVETAPASASSSYLCTGYKGCADAGYSNSGYAAHNTTMYWRMYAGHNCTNYVAYRMVQAGMPAERPWSGSGMARNWGPANSSLTNQTPAVGAVAWFARGLSGGTDGHVAYVEKVISPTQIVISEDMWNGDFHWAVLTKDGGTWPSGFIHFIDTKTLVSSAAPTVSGTAQVGVPLQGDRGAWKPAGATFAYQWLASGVPVAGATGVSFTPTAAQLGKALSFRVTATKAGYVAGTATTPATSPVVAGVLANTTPPSLSGVAQLGQVLTATPGVWSPAPDSHLFRWVADGVVLTRTTGPTLKLTRNLVGKSILVGELATKGGYASGRLLTAPIGPVVAGTIEVPVPFVPQGVTHYGSSLSVTGGTVTPADVLVAYSWYRDGVLVPGATAATYPLTSADLGHHLEARLTMTKTNYTTVVQSFDFATPVTTHPTISVVARPKRGAAAIGVRVKAPGVVAVTGPVVVTVGQQVVHGELVAGHVRMQVTDLRPGLRRFVVQFPGTAGIDPVSAVVKATVLRHRAG